MHPRDLAGAFIEQLESKDYLYAEGSFGKNVVIISQKSVANNFLCFSQI